ncbi:alpha/beta hydrolase [Thalassotalea castellviae]|uniref:Alpha/beta hydrolase-fold protein n=1 Tax=Thalassotalea castellviae TaxID=3075612 RepID=A0ABU2ZXC0_9GAMM|nr:alpha/beta hydrolase-fold protein [Thalassotalea sp. W431]MDT0602339.1 alpha/beta hydrolase-fold protein [Thalassotalea sp. W431]
MITIKKTISALFILALTFALGWYVSSLSVTPKPQDEKQHTAADNVQNPITLEMTALNRSRNLRIYLPPNYNTTNKRYPVLYMHDAQNLFDEFTSYSGEWGVDEALNTLAHTHQLELIVVGIDNGEDKRITELNPWDHAKYGKSETDGYLDFIVNQVKPYIDEHFHTLKDRDNTGIMGSSLGGITSHYAALKHPLTFGNVGVFSPSYWIASDITTFLQQHTIELPQRYFFLMGEAEGGEMLSDFNKVKAQLKTQNTENSNADLIFSTVAHGKHHESMWRTQFSAAALWLFQPPIKTANEIK